VVHARRLAINRDVNRATMAYLELHIGQQASKKIHLGSTFSIGRGPGNNLRFPDQRVSRCHARITHYGDHFLLEDLHSTNGTVLRNKQLAPGVPTELVEGDEIRIGPLRLIFHLYRSIKFFQ
jgi:3',5'-cyclic-nucleotide phosphodiesterase